MSDTDELNLLSFSQPMYVVVESDGQVEVCVNSRVPVVREATATVITLPQNATGIHCVISVVLSSPEICPIINSCRWI